MQLAELSRRSGVSIPSIKFYRREGLLSPGEREGRGRAAYDDRHVERLRLIRALVEAGGMPLAQVRAVLVHLDSEPDSVHEAFGRTLDFARPEETVDTARAEQLIATLGWQVEPGCAQVGALAAAVRGLEVAGFDLDDDHLLELARRLEPLAQFEIDGVPTTSPDEALRYVVLGTVLVRPVVLALRELAHQDASFRRFAPG